MRSKITARATGFSYNPDDTATARDLRQHATSAERAAWEVLRGRRALGLKFRRQQPACGFILDFYCASARLAIELDGPVHSDADQQRWDAERDAALARRGIRVIRIANQDATTERLTELIRAAVQEAPLPQGEGLG